jgi:cellobiose phosphorylase
MGRWLNMREYVISSDIYSEPPHLHRGGWTWYTGSAAWLSTQSDGSLGFNKTGDFLRPSSPSMGRFEIIINLVEQNIE